MVVLWWGTVRTAALPLQATCTVHYNLGICKFQVILLGILSVRVGYVNSFSMSMVGFHSCQTQPGLEASP